ncbi:hypothetical protein ADIARSV_2571 [Arcticibacter svalbardensis MN12-7]|uniref:Uncharacterized protein n=1 Tax=Arcticibacter svalbardensis MN12-7 TaxID=1150600 RepID=R9GS01_9SPHI|nr:hypothetical protein ADIARSV_2571 [Arcticibacter svalbardensis MN12-7]
MTKSLFLNKLTTEIYAYLATLLLRKSTKPILILLEEIGNL